MSITINSQALMADSIDNLPNKLSARAAIIGTSITETMTYRQASANAVSNGDGTWPVTVAATPRPMFCEGDIIKTAQGPVGFNSFKSEVLSLVGNTITVRPDQNYPINLTGTLPFCYAMNERQKNGWATYAELQSLGAFSVVLDAGIGGGDTSNLNYSFDSILTSRADEFDFVIAEAGTMNDVYARTWSFDTAKAQTTIYIDKIAALKKPFLMIGCCPRDSANGAWSSGKLDIVMKLNDWMQSYAFEKGGSFINPYRSTKGALTYLDAADANADPKSNVTDDAVHPNQVGSMIIGWEIAQWVTSVFPPKDILPTSVKESAIGMLNTNPLMQGSGGVVSANATAATVSGVAADDTTVIVLSGGTGLSVAGSVVARTEAADGDSLGNNQRVIITSSANVHIVEVRFGPSTMFSSVSNGDVIDGICSVKMTNGGTPGSGEPVSCRGCSLVLNTQTVTTLNHYFSSNGQGSNAFDIPSFKAVYDVQGKVPAPLSLHGAPSNIRISLYVILGAGASICVDVGRAGIYKNRYPFVIV